MSPPPKRTERASRDERTGAPGPGGGGGRARYQFLISHGTAPVSVPAAGADLHSRKCHEGQVLLPFDVAVPHPPCAGRS